MMRRCTVYDRPLNNSAAEVQFEGWVMQVLPGTYGVFKLAVLDSGGWLHEVDSDHVRIAPPIVIPLMHGT